MSFFIVTIAITAFLFTYIPTFQFAVPSRRSNELLHVSVIIPARNEAENIGHLLSSITEQVHEIIVVDDHSTDNTSEVAKQYGAVVIKPHSLPSGWLGKSWACWNGAKQATGDILIFLDADTIIEKNGLCKMIDRFEKNNGFVFIHPFHKVKKVYEKLSAMFHFVTYASMGTFHLFQQWTKPKGGFGQCVICSKKDYFAFGGHEAVKSEVVENMAFAQHVLQQNGSLTCVGGKGAVSMRMYPNGLFDLINGWKKSFASGASATHPLYLLVISVWITGMTTFVFQFPFYMKEFPFALSIGYALITLLLYRVFHTVGSFGFVSAFLFPIHIVFFVFVFLWSFVETHLFKTISWKGRQIEVDTRKRKLFK
ncbi:glycosyltransferase family 2 protein [Bacillus sp. CGMCC 1.16541]|uniref:glycosyltransferase n=1 Tax=Bacillus sp. CGMCC 1.16541 TaxID=2185143 RepID=UPI000D73670F|nr:glycosyltransferase family 2 protein [Bacillus sp. CGMCC 1.16541]